MISELLPGQSYTVRLTKLHRQEAETENLFPKRCDAWMLCAQKS